MQPLFVFFQSCQNQNKDIYFCQLTGIQDVHEISDKAFKKLQAKNDTKVFFSDTVTLK